MSERQEAGLHFPYGVWVASCTFVRTKVTCQLCQVGDYSSQLRIKMEEYGTENEKTLDKDFSAGCRTDQTEGCQLQDGKQYDIGCHQAI